MAEKYGVENLKVLIAAVCDVLNVTSEILANFGIWKLLGLSSVVQVLKGVNFDLVKQELGELSTAERLDVEAVFVQHLKLASPLLQAKVLASVNYLEEAVVLVGQGVDLVNGGIGLVKRVRDYFGV